MTLIGAMTSSWELKQRYELEQQYREIQLAMYESEAQRRADYEEQVRKRRDEHHGPTIEGDFTVVDADAPQLTASDVDLP